MMKYFLNITAMMKFRQLQKLAGVIAFITYIEILENLSYNFRWLQIK